MTVARFEEDAYEDGGETLTVALDTTATRVCLSTDATDVWPPLYFTPQRAREIAQALLDAARAADGSSDPASLFAEAEAPTEASRDFEYYGTTTSRHGERMELLFRGPIHDMPDAVLYGAVSGTAFITPGSLWDEITRPVVQSRPPEVQP
ncbi:hypothetical protein [Deinococcus yunweiensis]|uniref:hypothetical protein n=1 Tax=Deinococcus yunweiensis TaxID=367282 RepID=UPI00398F8034